MMSCRLEPVVVVEDNDIISCRSAPAIVTEEDKEVL